MRYGKSVILAVIGLLSACMNIESQDPSGADIVGANLSGGFTENERLGYYEFSKSYYRSGRISETGDIYNYSAEPYSIEIIAQPVPFASGNMLDARRANWVAGCSKDKFSDAVTCRMNILPQNPVGNAGGLFQIVDRRGNILKSCVLGHDFPGKRAAIRVDENSAFTTDTEGCISGGAASRLQQQLESGSRLLTRRIEWPYESSRDKDIIITGAYSAARELFRFSAEADLASLFSNPE